MEGNEEDIERMVVEKEPNDRNAWGSARSAPSKGYLEESSLKDGGGAEPLGTIALGASFSKRLAKVSELLVTARPSQGRIDKWMYVAPIAILICTYW